AKMKIIAGIVAAVTLAGLSVSAYPQVLPSGSYQQSCRDIRMQGTTLTAVCQRARGRGEQLTALNLAHCAGDIGNNNGQLQCAGGQPAAPAAPPRQAAPAYTGPGYAPAPGYPAPGYTPQPGSPGPGYGPPPRYAEEEAYREWCQRLRSEEHELRDSLGYTPYGEDRARRQYRLGRAQAARERCVRRGPRSRVGSGNR